MLGLGVEAITLLVSTGLSFWMKLQAQKNADMNALLKASIENRNSSSNTMDAANKRGTPWVRKYMSVVIISITFLGLICAPLLNLDTNLVMKVPQKSILYGLIKWGKTYDILSSEGFMIPEYAKQIAIIVCGFFYGSGFSKTQR